MAIVIVVASLMFTYLIVEKALKHAENIERIKHGYPLIDGTRPVKDEIIESPSFESRLMNEN